MAILQGLLGLIALTGFAWLIAENRRSSAWRIVITGLTVQCILALILLKTPGSQQVFVWFTALVLTLQEATTAGTSFVFGYIGGGALPFAESAPGASFILAFQALPLILLMSAISALLLYWKILPLIITLFAWMMRRTLGVGGAVSVSVAANIFIGMIEAPLLIRPYLQYLSRSELFMVMTTGMATIAGTVMALYATLLVNVVPDAFGHILVASIISAPAAIMVAMLMIPGSPASMATGDGTRITPSPDNSAMEAITRGTADGIQLFLNVIAMLVVLIALVAIVNMLLGLLPHVGGTALTVERILGWIMMPVVWLMGVPWSEAGTAGALIGTKTILNELVAYRQMSQLPAEALSEHSRLIMIYAMCGFANFGSLGIMLGGLTTMAPARRREIVELGLKSLVSGTLATCLTGTIVGLLI